MRSAIRVLVVGSDPADSDGGESLLEHAGDDVAVETVTTATALDRLAADRDGFDCVVVDRETAADERNALLESIRERWPELPAVAVVDDASSAVDAVEAGATDTLRWSAQADVSTLLARRVRNVVPVMSETIEEDLTPAEYRAVFDHVQCGVLLVDVTDDEFRYHRCNARMSELAGMPAGDIEGKTPAEAFGPEDGRAIEARYRECLDRGEPISYTVTADLPDGRAVREGYVRPVGADGEPDRLLVLVQEATRKREREAELRQSKRRLRALFEQSPDMINVHDAEGRIVECNPTLCEMTGYDEATLTEMCVWDIDRTIDREQARTLWEEMEPGDRRRLRGEYVRSDGSTFPVEVHIRRLSDDGTDHFIVISRDITDQRARERELRRKNERLEEFASVLSHDLRNPLQVLRGALDGAAATGEQAHFDRGHRAIDRMEDMITDILALARQGNTVEELDTVSLGEIVEGCWENVQTDEATLIVERDLRIRASEIRLKQLVENLLRNAIEHGGDDVRIRVGALEGGFFVVDDGHGVPAEDRERVFESGYSTAPSGTGFGLAIVEGIVDAHDWTVTLSEGEDGGARFEFTGVTVV